MKREMSDFSKVAQFRPLQNPFSPFFHMENTSPATHQRQLLQNDGKSSRSTMVLITVARRIIFVLL